MRCVKPYGRRRAGAPGQFPNVAVVVPVLIKPGDQLEVEIVDLPREGLAPSLTQMVPECKKVLLPIRSELGQ